jgi:hypothetical protein
LIWINAMEAFDALKRTALIIDGPNLARDFKGSRLRDRRQRPCSPNLASAVIACSVDQFHHVRLFNEISYLAPSPAIRNEVRIGEKALPLESARQAKAKPQSGQGRLL